MVSELFQSEDCWDYMTPDAGKTSVQYRYKTIGVLGIWLGCSTSIPLRGFGCGQDTSFGRVEYS